MKNAHAVPVNVASHKAKAIEKCMATATSSRKNTTARAVAVSRRTSLSITSSFKYSP